MAHYYGLPVVKTEPKEQADNFFKEFEEERQPSWDLQLSEDIFKSDTTLTNRPQPSLLSDPRLKKESSFEFAAPTPVNTPVGLVGWPQPTGSSPFAPFSHIPLDQAITPSYFVPTVPIPPSSELQAILRNASRPEPIVSKSDFASTTQANKSDSHLHVLTTSLVKPQSTPGNAFANNRTRGSRGINPASGSNRLPKRQALKAFALLETLRSHIDESLDLACSIVGDKFLKAPTRRTRRAGVIPVSSDSTVSAAAARS